MDGDNIVGLVISAVPQESYLIPYVPSVVEFCLFLLFIFFFVMYTSWKVNVNLGRNPVPHLYHKL